jgi:hypothetical protein
MESASADRGEPHFTSKICRGGGGSLAAQLITISRLRGHFWAVWLAPDAERWGSEGHPVFAQGWTSEGGYPQNAPARHPKLLLDS